MANTVLSLLAALIIFLILTENLTVYFYIDKSYIIEIHFIIFAVILKKSENGKKRKKEKREKRSFFEPRYSLLMCFIRHSNVKIHTLDLYIPESDPMKNAINYGIYSGAISSFLAFLENSSRFFEASNITLSYSEHNTVKKQINAELQLSFIDVLIASTEFIYFKLRSRLLRKG